jgi:hypothetical protein
MKNVLFLCLSTCVIFFSCSKSGTSSPSGGTNTISATVDGVNENFNNIVLAKIIDQGGGRYSLVLGGTTGTTASADVMTITVDGDRQIAAGAFSLTLSPTNHYWPALGYTKGGTNNYMSDVTGTLPTNVTITSITSTNVQGSFSGGVVLYNGTGAATKNVTNGKFNVNFK